MRNCLTSKIVLSIAAIILVVGLGQPCFGQMRGGMMGGMTGGMMGPAWGRGAWMGPGYWGNGYSGGYGGYGAYGGYGGYGYPGYGQVVSPPADWKAKFNEDTKDLQEKIQALSQQIDADLRQAKPDKEKILAEHKQLLDLQSQLQEKALKYQLENQPTTAPGQQPPYGGYGWGGGPGWGGPGWGMGGGRGWMRWGGPWGMGSGYPMGAYPGYGYGYGAQGYGYPQGMSAPVTPPPAEEQTKK